MRPAIPGVLRAAALAPGLALLAACNPLVLDSSGRTRPATEETVTGTWRNAEPDAQGHTVRMTLRIDADHNGVWARRVSGINADGTDTEYRREDLTWSVEGSDLVAEKTACQYRDPPDYRLSPDGCRAPLELRIPIKVNGNAWSVVEGEKVMLFRKDGLY